MANDRTSPPRSELEHDPAHDRFHAVRIILFKTTR
jgi:hypothetical protein